MTDENTSKPEENAAAPQSPTTTPEPTQPANTPSPTSAGATNGLAIAALVVGIVAAVTGWVPFWGLLVGAAAIVLGILSLKKANGKGMAIAGIVTGAIGALWGLLMTVFVIIGIIAGGAAYNEAQRAADQQQSQNQALADAKKDFAQGETANFANKYEVKVNDVQTDYQGSQIFQPDEGKQYIVVDLTIKNISEDTESYSPFIFSVTDNGEEQNAVSVIRVPNELGSGQLEAGESVTGSIVYEVSATPSDLKLVYSATVFDQSYSSKRYTYTLAL